ncbi:trna ligase [Coemansia interrupta]|uniref:tRNA ligase n=1 Tax=Coemansia interrupta TaxID=1126814 RepID=A0A9W8HCH2_9FUNG|nr:trna ligase [Coemansia interrupta]
MQTAAVSGGPATQKEQYEFRQLLKEMTELSRVTPSSKRIVRQTTHEFMDRNITSWKCTEYLYKKTPCPLPTQARGLFSSSSDEGDGEAEIVARGYDKFFNIGEVPKTQWQWIRDNTQGPYELTVKENGCLILAAGLDKDTLLVTSKHAIHVPHAQVGSSWVDKHLASVGRTREELAAFLHEHNATAVFELCDDSFEEHILEYPERMRGLYLHGINRNSVELDTWPSDEVIPVAERFGFMKTGLYKFDTVDDGKAFADRVREDQMLDGRAIEGFVVRCRIDDGVRPFMFKIKYDEPYLMFREWRELTSRILAEKPYHTRYALSEHYVRWVKSEIKRDPSVFENFGTKGVIGARRRFLEFYETSGGSLPAEVETVHSPKILLVPVGTIGCGKTTMGQALSKLFGFVHVQNDNLRSKKRGMERFNMAVNDALNKSDLVFADRNNHVRALRESLTTSVKAEHPGCRQIALYWSHDNASAERILEATGKRVVGRGENHQLLVASLPNFRQIMRHFVDGFAPIDTESAADQLFEDVVELDPLAEAGVTLRVIVDALCSAFPEMIRRPSDEEIREALRAALDYKPEVVFAQTNKGAKVSEKTKGKKAEAKKTKLPAYIGLVPHQFNINKWLQKQIAQGTDVDWVHCKQLTTASSLKAKRHITLAHISAVKNKDHKEIFHGYVGLFDDEKSVKDVLVKCTADYMVSDGRIMALRIASMEVSGSKTNVPEAVLEPIKPEGVTRRLKTTNRIPHITMGTDGKTQSVVSNEILKTVFGQDNASESVARPDGWTVVPITLSFDAVIEKFYS